MTKLPQLRKKTLCLHYSFLIIAALLCLLFASRNTSPLYPGLVSDDAAIFLLIGRGMTRGYRLYADLFDHKGPILFFIQALASLSLPSKTGVFLLHALFCILSLILLYHIARLLVSPAKAFVCSLLSLIMYLMTFESGNLTEDYCLPFILLAIYLSASFFLKVSEHPKQHPPAYSYIYGFCLGFVAFIRLNNCTAILAVIWIVAYDLLSRRQYRVLLRNAGLFLFGLLTVTLPVCTYFVLNHTFSEMLHAAFLHNFKYAVSGAASRTLQVWIRYFLFCLPALCLCLFSYVCKKQIGRPCFLLFICASLFCAASISLGYTFLHYATLLVPFFGIAAILLMKTAESKKAASLFMAILLFCSLSGYVSPFLSAQKYNFENMIYQPYRPYYAAIRAMAEKIPAEERSSVLGYNVSSDWYLTADLIPCYKYFTLQDWFTKADPSVAAEINQFLEKSPPLWIVTNHMKPIENMQVQKIITNNYHLVASAGEYDLLRLRP